MNSPLSFKKDEQNIWLNWTLDWKLDYNHCRCFCPGFNITVYVCYFICPTMALPFFLVFVTNLSESFKILTRPYRFHFFKLSEIIWTLGEWKNIFSNSYSNSDLLIASFLQYPTILFFLNPKEWVEFNLPLLLLVIRSVSLGRFLESQSITDFSSDGNCEHFVLPIKINISEFVHKQYYLIISMSLWGWVLKRKLE